MTGFASEVSEGGLCLCSYHWKTPELLREQRRSLRAKDLPRNNLIYLKASFVSFVAFVSTRTVEMCCLANIHQDILEETMLCATTDAFVTLTD